MQPRNLMSLQPLPHKHKKTEGKRHSWFNLWSWLRISKGEGNGTPLQYSCLENPMDGGAWWSPVHGVTKSWARLIDFTFTFHFHALEKEMATHSSILAWRIPGTEEPSGLPSMGSHRVGHDLRDLAAARISKRLPWLERDFQTGRQSAMVGSLIFFSWLCNNRRRLDESSNRKVFFVSTSETY